jgi:hypothetical protein
MENNVLNYCILLLLENSEAETNDDSLCFTTNYITIMRIGTYFISYMLFIVTFYLGEL